jgi:signal transduction histidine kinase
MAGYPTFVYAGRISGSADARIELHVQTDRVLLRIRDFGVGMPIDKGTGSLAIGTGVGVSSLRERVKQLGGEINILRAEPGTLVEAVIPLFA